MKGTSSVGLGGDNGGEPRRRAHVWRDRSRGKRANWQQSALWHPSPRFGRAASRKGGDSQREISLPHLLLHQGNRSLTRTARSIEAADLDLGRRAARMTITRRREAPRSPQIYDTTIRSAPVPSGHAKNACASPARAAQSSNPVSVLNVNGKSSQWWDNAS